MQRGTTLFNTQMSISKNKQKFKMSNDTDNAIGQAGITANALIDDQ